MKISIKVITNAKQNDVVQDFVDLAGVRMLKVRVNQPPEEGKANKAVIELLAKHFKVKKNAVDIIAGETSRNKIVEINFD
jgi:uncharacterized protein (TIGR00251 family)